MTARELARRGALFMAELGRGEAMAQLEQRTGTDHSLPDAYARFVQRYAVGIALDPTPMYGAYADAFAETTRSNRGENFSRSGAELRCELCGFNVIRTRIAVIAHVLQVTHLGRAEAQTEPERGHSRAPMKKPRFRRNGQRMYPK